MYVSVLFTHFFVNSFSFIMTFIMIFSFYHYRDTATSAGPKSFNKGKHGFSKNSFKQFELSMKPRNSMEKQTDFGNDTWEIFFIHAMQTQCSKSIIKNLQKTLNSVKAINGGTMVFVPVFIFKHIPPIVRVSLLLILKNFISVYFSFNCKMLITSSCWGGSRTVKDNNPYHPCVAFHIGTSHFFAVLNKWLVSVRNATLDWSGLRKIFFHL